ncbi:MAG: type II toxin-antitoxin system VapC family toxin [Deltaproteobacteria bacterium]|nr:type II toxin-antitoxin system VapC family toxin [Deltaproteobacteria bacterium]
MAHLKVVENPTWEPTQKNILGSFLMNTANILLDTGPLVALLDPNDQNFQKNRRLLEFNNFIYRTTFPVICEVIYLLRKNLKNIDILFSWIKEEGIILENLSIANLLECQSLMKKYKNVPMDFADASLVCIGNSLGINQILSFDSDFDIYRLKSGNFFKNLI